MLGDALAPLGTVLVIALLWSASRRRKVDQQRFVELPDDCFACRPDAPAGPELRRLCADHKRACVLADGAPLYATLALAKPPDWPLEGSSLGWLYNPVFVVDSAGRRQRGWTSFVAGGMAVFEDRFEPKDPFEFWMYQRPDMVELLKGVSMLPSAPRNSPAVIESSLQSAFLWAYRNWEWHRAIEKRSNALGRWPASFEEVAEVLRSTDSVSNQSPQDEADFLVILASLATKRLASPYISGGRL